jgi:N-acetylmuramoyl-L-alanine amidase
VLSRKVRLARTFVGLALVFGLATYLILDESRGSQLAQVTTPVNVVALPEVPSAGPAALDSTLFSPGSCVAFAPTAGNRHLTVFLDAGHGGPDPGGQGVTSAGKVIVERDLTLPVVLDATRLLRAEGFRVVVSRTTAAAVVRLRPSDLSGTLFSLSGKHRDTAARPLCANLAGAAALVSVHFNVGASRSNAGAETTYDSVRRFASRSLALANLLQSAIVKALHQMPSWNVPDNGVVTDDLVGNSLTSAGAAYGHLLVLGPAAPPYFDSASASAMPGALVEPLYLTDPFEGSIAASPAGQRVLAEAIASAVTQFLG